MNEVKRSLVIGTAGHIDHGKTALVKALTGIDTDRLREEKERGITIDIGFAKLQLPSGIQASIVDVPGHERFIRNMVAGASGIDLVMLVIAADEGIMPQTREHLEICELLGIKEGVVVLTKIDLVDEEWLELVKAEVEDYLKGTFLKGAPIVPFSAVTLQGKEELIKILDEKAKTLRIRERTLPFRLPIDGVFLIKGFGLVVRGTALSGEVSLNQELMLYPHQKRVKVRNLQVHGESVEKAFAGMRVAVNILGAEKEEIKRGDVLAEPEVLEPSQWIDVKIKVLKEVEPPLKAFETLLFYVGTSEILGKLILFNKDYLKDEEDIAQIFLQKPLCAWRGDRFILRRPGTNETVGGGVILNPLSQRRKRTKPWERKELEFLASSKDESLILYYIEKKGGRGISLRELSLSVSIFGKNLLQMISNLKSNILEIKAGDTIFLFTFKALEHLKREIIERLRKFHESNPFSPGLTKEFLKSRLSLDPREILFERALEDLIHEGVIQRERELYFIPEFQKKSSTLEELKKQLQEKFLKEGLTPRDVEEILLEFGKDVKAAEEVLKLLLREGILVKLSEKLIFHSKVLRKIEEDVKAFFKNHSELTIGDFKKIVGEGVSRKYLIPILEYLDKQKITLRVGDKRVPRKI
ncbi:translation elongation factor [Caldimicrobium thiodismutans]|uniref:Selenocysteine-specific elongation factor n=1 Tax=Caldimicrobium thiodismutans TaxID=1653476 RepID=A0A0U5AXL3_9BACT|nr:selenocysteine-specific translation elongation factor [Caldimicrobium thiodismutans]BAU22473.1 translation elongation factor [Caldimicrobium thiodismutans]